MFEENFDTVTDAVSAIKATVDDIDSVTVLLSQSLADSDGEPLPEVAVVLHYCDGNRGFVSRAVAPHLLNDGIFERLRVPIEYV